MERVRNISKSMVSYLRRAREHKEFLLKETHEFERGKRHLANMMGLDASEMTQADIDKAIKYLFPVGLFQTKARPMMKHPDLIFKVQKDAQFDIEGRPNHYLFYTNLPNYYEALSEIGRLSRSLNKFEDEQLAKGIVTPPDDSQYNIAARKWLTNQQMCDKFIEKVHAHHYEYFIKSIEKLAEHPYSNRCASFFDQYSIEQQGQSLNLELPEIKKDTETGEIYTEMDEYQKDQFFKVKVVLNGSGKFDFDGNDILFFDAPYMRRAIADPLVITGMLDKVDVYAKTVKFPKVLGQGCAATTIRYCIATSVAAYVDPEMREKLRLAGLLTRDVRRPERKKPGQMKARRKYTWKKR